MNLGRLSINQPILAMVLSIVLLIVGAIAYTTLPVAEYPQVVPPTVVVTTQYPGASAQTVSDTVAAPIEQQINGVEDMLYLYSQATSNGQLTITVTFKLGTDLDKAQVLVQNRVAIAQPQLPEEVQRNGVVTRKNSPDILMVVFMLSPDDTFDQLYISNYALLQVRDQLLRLDGIGDIQIFGARDYSMRLWLDPDKIANLGMTAGDVLAAIRAQNLQITGGQLAAPPIADRAFQPNLTFTGRLKDIQQFEDIVVKAGADGRTVRLRDVARIELGALDYTTNSFLLRKTAVAMLVTQRPGSNALATAKNISDTMVRLKANFPKGLDYNIGYNPTEFIAQSVHELIKTIYEAMALVVIVVLVFLQGWRPAIIPIVAIPVSLVGTFAVDGGARLCDQQSDPVRPRARGRHRGRRRDRGGRKCRAASSRRHEPARCRAQDHGGGRRRAGLDRAGACARCSCRPRSSAASPDSSFSNSPSPSRWRPRSPASAR